MNLTTMTVDHLIGSYRNGDLSPVDVTSACLSRIEEVDPLLNAFLRVDVDGALSAARASAERWSRGTELSPLDGVPTAIKDTMAMAGWPTLKGSSQSDPTKVVPEDAPSVGRLRAAGAVFLGKTNVPEFAWKGVCDSPLTGITRNPWNPDVTPGGSSGGAAAAVASGMTVLATGTDGGGSIRMPAAFCGVFGLKPTFSVVPIYPPSSGGTLSHVGPITRTVTDAAHMMSVIARPDPREVYPALEDPRSWTDTLGDGVAGLRIAYSPTYGFADVDPQIAGAVRTAVDTLAGLGADVVETDPGFTDPRREFCTIWDAYLSQTLIDLPAELLARSDPGLVQTMDRGRVLTADALVKADAARVRVTIAISALLQDFDLLISPQLPLTAFAVGQDFPPDRGMTHWTDWTPFTYPLNLSRHPAASVPVGLDDRGLPMAMQVVGRHFDDRLVLQAAFAYEQAHPFAQIG